MRRNISVSELGRLLEGRTTWCFPGHGDAMLQSEPVLAFVGVGGAVEAVSIATLVETVRPHVLTGKLQLIVLTGCCTARLATKLRKQAFVPYVVCWETVLNDEAGRIFGTAFAQAVASNPDPNLHPDPNLTLNRIPKPEPNPDPTLSPTITLTLPNPNPNPIASAHLALTLALTLALPYPNPRHGLTGGRVWSRAASGLSEGVHRGLHRDGAREPGHWPRRSGAEV